MKITENVITISIDLLIPNPNQPRKKFDDASLEELAKSIKEYGILNPILVRKKDERYEIIAGERRYRAAKKAGLNEVPVIIKEVEDKKIREIALIENLQRENITPIEEANSYNEILRQSNITEKELSEMIGKSQSFISNKLRLLKLPKNIQEALIDRKISERHARSLMTINDASKQTELLNRIITERLTVKELDNIINEKEITTAEIDKAINDIMKSLDSTNNKKEEKESDKMNQGSFFPNLNNNASLNSMNMQAMNMSEPNMVQPTPQVNNQVAEMPIFNGMQASQQPTSNIAFPNTEQNVNMPNIPVNEPVVNQTPNLNTNTIVGDSFNNQENTGTTFSYQDIPLFSEQNYGVNDNVNSLNNIPSNVAESTPVTPIEVSDTLTQPIQQPNEYQMPTTPVVDTPLFAAPDINFAQQPSVPSFEVPVSVTPEVQKPVENKLVLLESFLNNNGISYKKYHNDNNECIIVEM